MDSASDNLLKLIKQLFVERSYDGVRMLFESPSELAVNMPLFPAIAMDLYNDVLAPCLNDDIHSDKPELFDCCNALLTLVAQHAPLEPFMLELMEKIEESTSHGTFTAYLRALQAVLLRQGRAKPQSIEWCLSSVVTTIRELPLPEYLSEGYDEKQALLLEQDRQVEDLLAYCITVELCYEPLLKQILEEEPAYESIFRACNLTRRNAFACSMVQLLGKPLALLQMVSVPKSALCPRQQYVCKPVPRRRQPQQTQANYLEARANAGKAQTYMQQVTGALTRHITSLFGDPYYLLSLVEKRSRWKRRLDAAKGVYEMSCHNIFLIAEKLPLTALATYYHALFVDQQLPVTAPKIYAPLFLFESCLYLVAQLLEQEEPPLQHCGIRLNDYILSILTEPVPQDSLDLEVHKRYCEAICKVAGYSPEKNLRQLALQSLHYYILVFEDAARYFILKNLLSTVHHDGIFGYLAGVYKDLVSGALDNRDMPPSEFYSGVKFRSMLLKCVCVLPNDVKSDILMHSVSLSNAFNILRFMALRDVQNLTGFWDVLPVIEERLLKPFNTAFNFSLAHYKAYRERVKNGQSASDDELMQQQLSMFAVNIENSGGGAGFEGSTLPNIGRQDKLEVLSDSISGLETLHVQCRFASESIEQGARKRKLQQGHDGALEADSKTLVEA